MGTVNMRTCICDCLHLHCRLVLPRLLPGVSFCGAMLCVKLFPYLMTDALPVPPQVHSMQSHHHYIQCRDAGRREQQLYVARCLRLQRPRTSTVAAHRSIVWQGGGD